MADEVIVQVRGQDVNLTTLMRQVERQMAQTDSAAKQAATGIEQQLGGGMRRTGNAALALQQAQARLEVSQGNLAGAAQRLTTVLAAQDTTTVKTIGAQTQLQQIQNRLAAQAGQTTGAFQRLNAAIQQGQGLIGAAGFTLGAQQLISLTGAAIDSANALDTSSRLTRMIAGDQATYNKILATAKEQQALFGGSLKDNLDDLASFAVQSRISGASLDNLISTAQRLATFDPGQGLRGASIALREALSGNINSLAMRFELPKNAIRALGDTSLSSADRLRVLNDVLTQAGIPANAAAQAVSETTRVFNENKAAVEAAGNAWGAFWAQALAPAAQGATALLTGNQQLRAAIDAQVLAIQNSSATFDEYNARFDQLAAKLAESGQVSLLYESNIQRLNESQFAAVQSTTAFGTAITPVIGAMSLLTGGAEQLRQQIDVQRQSIDDANAALLNAIQTDQQAAIAAQQVSQAKADLERVTQMVIQGLLTNEQAAAILGQRYPALAGQTDLLIQKQLQLAGAAREAANALAATGAGKLLSGGLNWLNQQKQTAAAMRDYNEAVGGSAVKLKNLQRDLQGVRQGSAEWYRIQTQIANLQGKGGGGGGGGRAARLSEAEKFAQKQEAVETSLYQKLEDAAADHAERLLDIERDFYKRSEEQRKKNEVGKRQSRYSFYSTITDAGSGIEDDGARNAVQAEAQRIAAEYEQAFAEAQRMAQAGQQQLAAEYLALKQRQLEEDLRFAEERARAQAEGDKAEVARLDALNKLREEAQAEEEKQLLEGGDANQKARDEATANEQQRYDEATQSAETAADRKIAAAQRSTDAILTENQALQEQARLYQQIGGRPGSPTTPTGTPTTGGTAPQTASAPTNAPATGGAGDPGAAWGDLEAAIGRLQDATSGGLRDVVRAVQGLQSQFVR